MDAPEVVSIMREGIRVLMLISAPMMLTALVVGLTVSLIQALTQVQEMTLTFVPKIISMLVMMMLVLPFMIQTLQDYTDNLFARIASIDSGE